MRAYLRLLLLFALITGAAYLASRILVPDAVPVADNERPQWYLQVAFVLRSIELIGFGGMILILIAGCTARFTPSSTNSSSFAARTPDDYQQTAIHSNPLTCIGAGFREASARRVKPLPFRLTQKAKSQSTPAGLREPCERAPYCLSFGSVDALAQSAIITTKMSTPEAMAT